MPRLFASSAPWVAEGTGVDEGVQTPFGLVTCTASVGGQEVVAADRERWRASDIAWLERLESSGIELERLTCKLQPTLPEGMRVDGCWGILWRFLAHQEIAHFTAAARLTAPFPEGSGHTGEHLVAIAFEGDAGEMHIGTQDEDALAERAGDGTLPDRWWRDPPDGPWFATVEEAMAAAPPPDEWTKRWYESHGPVAWWREFRMLLSDIKDIIHPPPPSYPMDTFAVEIHRNGVTVSLPPLIPGDRGELQFLVAWTMPRDEHDASASYAVDQDPGEILSQAGCT